MITFSSSAVTHRGRVRTSNEDNVVVTDRLVAVADGLGGHAAGEVASQIAVDRIAELGELGDFAPDDLVDAIDDANRLINAEARRHREHAGMGTTLCGVGIAIVDGSAQCIVFNIGDSRVYGMQDGRLQQLSVDHSEVQEMRDAGWLSAQQAAHHPRRNVITRCLGVSRSPAPDMWVFSPPDGQRFLVCSDGLTTEVDDEAIAALMAEQADPKAAASALVDAALAAGGRDNIAVVVVNVSSTSEAADAGSAAEPS